MSEDTTAPIVENASADAAPEGSGVDQINQETAAAAEAAVEETPVAETTDELKEQVEDAIEEGATEEEVKDMIREFDIKVNGKSKKIKLDLNDNDAIIRQLQLAAAGQGAMQDKAELEKLVNQELLGAKSNPWDFIENTLGLNADELLEQRMNEKIEQMKKSPETVEREKIQKELEEARAKLAQQEKAVTEEKELRTRNELAVSLDQEITSALNSDKELPKTRKTVIKIVDALNWAMDNGFPDASVADVLPSVKEEIKREINEFISEMPDDLMESYVGKKNIERLRKKRLGAMKQATNVNVPPVTNAQSKEDIVKEKVHARDFFRNLNRA